MVEPRYIQHIYIFRFHCMYLNSSKFEAFVFHVLNLVVCSKWTFSKLLRIFHNAVAEYSYYYVYNRNLIVLRY